MREAENCPRASRDTIPGANVPFAALYDDRGHVRHGNSNVVWDSSASGPARGCNKAGETRLRSIQLNGSAFYNSDFTGNQGVFPIDNLNHPDDADWQYCEQAYPNPSRQQAFA